MTKPFFALLLLLLPPLCLANTIRALVDDRTHGNGESGGAGAEGGRNFDRERRTQPPGEDTVVDLNTDPSNLQQGLQPSCNNINAFNFNVCLDLESDYSNSFEDWMSVFPTAKQTWERVISGDLRFGDDNTDIAIRSSQVSSIEPSQCTSGYPVFIDDLYICAKDEEIDGRGGVLGYARISIVVDRDKTQPVVGDMRYDTVDIERLMKLRVFGDVVLHEIGHLLGIGTLWRANGLLNHGFYSDTAGGRTTRASQEWRDLGCESSLPVETDFGSGTAYGHFDEDCLQDEMMTGFSERRRVPISRITVGALADLGYLVDMNEADVFRLEDIGECCQYCSGGTRPCPGHTQRRILGTNETDSPTERRNRRRLSDEGVAAVTDFARQKLSQIRQEHAEHVREEDPLDNNGADYNLRFVGGDFIHVLYQEGDEIFDMGVSWDMVR